MKKDKVVDILINAQEHVTFEKSNHNYIVHKVKYDSDLDKLIHLYYIELRKPEGLDFNPYIIFGDSNINKKEALKSLIDRVYQTNTETK